MSKTGSKKARNSAARLAAVQCVYQMRMTGMDAAQTVRDHIDHHMGQDMDGDVFVSAETELLSNIVRGVQERGGDIADMIDAALQKRKSAAEPEALLMAILACGAYELLAHNEIDSPLIIAEYMNVANAFFTRDEPKVVNAVLDQLKTALRAG